MILKIKRMDKEAKLPVYGHSGDAGMDLFSAVDYVLRAGEVYAVPTGIKMEIPPGYVGLIWDKSGLSLRGLHRLAGVVDAGYRGEVKVVLANLGADALPVEKGMKIAQMLIQPVVQVDIVDVEDLDDSSRGEGGFGSTGKY
jgi:dUTP pyrophosphatase